MEKKVTLASVLATFSASHSVNADTHNISLSGNELLHENSEAQVFTSNEALLSTLIKVREAKRDGLHNGIVVPGLPGLDSGCTVCGTYTQGGTYTQNENTDLYTQSDHYDPNKLITDHDVSVINEIALRDLIEVKSGVDLSTFLDK